MEKHILLIDDDPDEIDIFIDALSDTGWAIRYSSASTAPGALKLLQRLVPDYIILDYNMPKINGLECLAQIKAMQHVLHVPVIMYSSAMDEDEVSTAKILGAVGYIKKPYDMRTLPSLLKPYF